MGQHEPPRVRLGRLEQIRLRPNRRLERHDHLLANRVDGRVGHLREELLEVVRGHARLRREGGERRVDAHRAKRLLAARHGGDEQVGRLLGEAVHRERRVERSARRVRRRRYGRLRHPLVQLEGLRRHPLLVRPRRRHRLLQLLVGDDALLRKVNQEHAPRLEPRLCLDDRLVQVVEHANLRREQHAVVPSHVVPRGAQPVPVEARADVSPVGEGHHRGPVPRLHQVGVVRVERLARRAAGLALPRLGNHHHHRLVQRTVACAEEQLGDGVEVARVGELVRADWAELGQGLAEVGGLQQRLARAHHVLVAAQRVDLAVVAEGAEGLRARPRGEGVRGEARVDEGEVRGVLRGLEVDEVAPHLLRRELALVDKSRRVERADVKVSRRVASRCVDLVRSGEAKAVELAVERSVGQRRAAGRPAHKQHLCVRLRLERRWAERRVVHWDRPPADQAEAEARDVALDHRLALGHDRGVAREEDVARAERARRRQRHTEVCADRLGQKRVRHAGEHASAVARGGLAAAAAAVRHPHQHRVCVAHNLVARLPL
mmetsp:Transcript_2815/g.8698  ORF Transcript_2815/g.8698 Transcript_2815/m.8698 type:complete len:546 (-) Transcript_2815:136-1773(-)